MKNIFLSFILMITSNAYSQVVVNDTSENQVLPKITKIVNDFEDLLKPFEEDILSDILYEYDVRTTNQIVIVTIASIEPFDNIFDFSLKLAQQTGAGTSEKNNGIMIVISNERRDLQIQNGDGIIQKLTNAETQSIISNIIIPEFKKGNYFEGLKAAILEIQKELD